MVSSVCALGSHEARLLKWWILDERVWKDIHERIRADDLFDSKLSDPAQFNSSKIKDLITDPSTALWSTSSLTKK